MAANVIICPWCQSEIIQEAGEEPDKFCPVCDNELSGYRTLRFGLGDEEPAEDEEEAEDDALYGRQGLGDLPEDLEGLGLDGDDDLRGKDEALLRYEDTVEAILDEQEFVPECPQCREYMVETGRQVVQAASFAPKRPERLRGGAIIEAPFSMTLYMCPSCFTMAYALSEEDRSRIGDRLSRDPEADRK
ncbi:hypothetical protein SAMN05216312_10294 [Cohnella sp. OV330]|uniref:hypothetical protein n=1 Tax=Cohnella sp. OV330 TaxID=1855288 RepID=UPI0008F219BE|nr:hypothetical protein [Cohnella sp. OV330]SFA89486.1 hypothetical protein SAMN05216312_10294 [Cohnella sp. OV330]